MSKLAKNYLIKIAILSAVVFLDLLTKDLFYHQSFGVLPYLIGVRDAVTLNTGGAWGLFSNFLPALIIFTLLFLGIVVFIEAKWKNTSTLYSLALSFIVGGALGNLIDRLVLGGVRDFIYFPFMPSFPTFNLADSFLCIGMVLLVIYILFVYKTKEKTNDL